MKTLYAFEEELLETGYDFEPKQEGYRIDDLNKEDRSMLSGMLYVLHTFLPAWKGDLEEENEGFGILGKIANECLDKAYRKLENSFESEVREIVVSCLDRYKERE